MRIFIDIDSSKIVISPGTTTSPYLLGFKRGSSSIIEVIFYSGLNRINLADGATGVLGLKELGKYDSELIVFEPSWDMVETSGVRSYFFNPTFNTAPLNALLGHEGVGGDLSNDLDFVDLMFEIVWEVNGQQGKTQTLTARVYNDVIKESESVLPLNPLYSPPTPIADEAALYALTGLTAGARYKLLSDGSVREYRGDDGTDAEFSSYNVDTTEVADATHGASFDGEPLAGIYHYNSVTGNDSYRASHVKSFPSRANAAEIETMSLYNNQGFEVGIGVEPMNVNYFAYLNLPGDADEEEFYSDYDPSVWSDLNGDPLPAINITKAPEATESNWLNVTTNTIVVADNRQKHALNNLADGVLVLIKKHPLNSSGGLEKYSANEAITNLDPVKLVGRDVNAYSLNKVFYNRDPDSSRVSLSSDFNTISKSGSTWNIYALSNFSLAYSNADNVEEITDVTAWTKASDGLVDPDFSVVSAPAANEQRWKTLSPTVHYQRLETDVDIASTTTLQNVFDDFRPEYGAMYHLEMVVELVTPAKNGSGGFTANFAKLETHGTSATGDDNIYTLRDRCDDPNSLPTTHVSANHLNQGNVALATKHSASTAVLISLTRTFERTVIGDLYVQTSQRVAEATPLTIKAGSYIHIIRR